MSDSDKEKLNNNENQTKVLSNSEQFLQEILNNNNRKDYSEPDKKSGSLFNYDAHYFQLKDCMISQEEPIDYSEGNKVIHLEKKYSSYQKEEKDLCNENIFDLEKIKCDNLFKEALEYRKNSQYFKAILILKEILAIFPNNLNFISELCVCLFEQNKINEAKELANKGLELAQTFSNNYYVSKFYSFIARSYREMSDYKTAIKYYKLAILKDYFDLDKNYSLADCYIKIKDYDEAIKICEKAYSSKDEMDFIKLKEFANLQNTKAHSELTHIELGDKYFSNKQDKLALVEYETANKIVPENVSILEKLFDVQMRLGLNNEAIKTALEITSKDIETIKNYYDGHGEFILLSKIYSGLYNIYNSSWHFIKANEASSMFEYYQKILRGLYESVFNKDKCIASLKAAFESKPNRYEALEKLIVNLSLFKEYEESIKYASIGLSMAKAENNKNKILYFCESLADDFNEIKNYEKSINYYNLALQHTQDNQKKLRIYGLMISCFREAGNLEQFSVYMEKSKKLIEVGTEDSSDVQSLIVEEKAKSDKNSDYCKSVAILNKGLELFKNNNYQEALNAFKESYFIDSQNLKLLDAYSRCLKEAGYLNEALAIANEGYDISKRDYNEEYLKIFQNLID